MHCILCIVLCALHSIRFSRYFELTLKLVGDRPTDALYSMHCILCIVLYTLYYMHCILCIVFYALFSMHSIICIVFYVLYSMHWTRWWHLTKRDGGEEEEEITTIGTYRAAIAAKKSGKPSFPSLLTLDSQFSGRTKKGRGNYQGPLFFFF